MANSRITIEIIESSESTDANEFDIESYKLGTDPAFPDEIQNESIGKKSFLIVMNAKLVEFHRLSASSMLGTIFPKVKIRSYEVRDDDTSSRSFEHTFDDARPINFQLNSGPSGLAGHVTFIYGKAEASEF